MKIQAAPLGTIYPDSLTRERPTRAADKRDRPASLEREPNYRGFYNRVVNSNLDRSEKAQFIERIKNAAAGEQERPEREADSVEPSRRRSLSVA